MRGQVSLPALAIALLLVTATTVFAVTTGRGALLASDRDPIERQQALGVSERLVSADGPLTRRANVLDAAALGSLTPATLRNRYGLPADAAVSVRLDSRPLVRDGDAGSGTTVERLVLVANRSSRTVTPRFGGTRSVTLPRRTGEARLAIRPSGGANVTAVRANGRVVLRNASGLNGSFAVDLSRRETTRFEFAGNGTLQRGDVTVTFPVERTHKAVLSVTVAAGRADDG